MRSSIRLRGRPCLTERRPASWSVCLLAVAVLCVLSIDLVTVSRRYVRARNISTFRAENPVADYIERDARMGRMSDYLSSRSKFDPVWRNYGIRGIDFLEPRRDHPMPDDYRNYFDALKRHPLRLWQLTNTRYILGAVAKVARLLENPAFEPVMYADVRNGVLVEARKGLGKNVLLRYTGALPRALVYYSWREAGTNQALRLLASSEWSPEQQVLVPENCGSNDAPDLPVPAAILSYRHNRVELAVEASANAVVLLNDKYDPDWDVTVDGKQAELLRCNYIMRGVSVPSGRHVVVFTYRPGLIPFALSLGGCVAVFIAGVTSVWLRRGRREP